jgi:vacuolar protein sorting-associated protein 11
LSASLAYLAVGLADGTVLLYRHLDQSIFSGSTSLTALPKPRAIQENTTEPVTGIGFREPSEDNPNVYLFIVTISRVLTYQASGKGSGGAPTEVDEVGCDLGCATMDWRAKDMVIAKDEAIYICSTEGRGACYAYEGRTKGSDMGILYLLYLSRLQVFRSLTPKLSCYRVSSNHGICISPISYCSKLRCAKQ